MNNKIISALIGLAKRVHSSGKKVLPEEIYKAISYFSYELSVDSYKDLINILKQMEV